MQKTKIKLEETTPFIIPCLYIISTESFIFTKTDSQIVLQLAAPKTDFFLIASQITFYWTVK